MEPYHYIYNDYFYNRYFYNHYKNNDLLGVFDKPLPTWLPVAFFCLTKIPSLLHTAYQAYSPLPSLCVSSAAN